MTLREGAVLRFRKYGDLVLYTWDGIDTRRPDHTVVAALVDDGMVEVCYASDGFSGTISPIFLPPNIYHP